MAQNPMQLFGDKRLQAALMDLEQNSANRVMKPAIGKALTPVKRQAKANAKRHMRSGALDKSIAKQTGRSRKKNRVWGRVYVKSIWFNWSRSGGEPEQINAAKYAHLLEFGHGGPSPAPAHPFLRPAMSQRRAQVGAILIQEGRENLNKFAGRLRKKYGTMAAARKAKQVGRFL